MRVDFSGAGALAGAMNSQKFGAAVVSKTMDYTNSGKSSQSSKGGMSEMNQGYDFAKDILSTYTQSQGVIVNIVT
ncbi:hypothetical protein SAMN05660653_02893 [Desulfonatronum thiosulfatophilum]|uniref:Uncharacterized protein n=1 Tax=Desulfonatronum thiosulfatophilum TaxID=617002 RepID=A0A1G6EJ08_9BACT|nr:hypothetical protein [Desulfonatronum thiosulfatophilum]SDB57417.1 hypothetical protein SAMN05660653_02893 [Desulfonatronum thiosulfatophilum]